MTGLEAATGDGRSAGMQSSSSSGAHRDLWQGFAFGSLTCLIWGIQPLVSKRAFVDGLTPVDVTLLRFLAAGLVLLPATLRARPFPVGRLGWRRACVLTIVAGAPFSLMVVGGVAFAPPLHSAVIPPGLIPVVAMALAYFVMREVPALSELASLALVVCGLVLFSYEALSGAPSREGAWLGDVIFAAAAVMWASFGFLGNRWHADPVGATAAIAILSLLSIPLWAFWQPLGLFSASLSGLALQALYQGVLVGAVSLYLYRRAVELLGPVRAALFVSPVPLVTATVDLVYLGELPSRLEASGMVAVVLGMMLSTLAPARTERASRGVTPPGSLAP